MRALLVAAAMSVTPASKAVLKRRRSTVSPIALDALDDFLRAIETALGGSTRRAPTPGEARLDWSPETLSVRR